MLNIVVLPMHLRKRTTDLRDRKRGGGGEGKNDQMYKMVSSQEIKQLTFQVENNLRNMISVTV